MFIENVKKSSLNLVSNQGTSDLKKKHTKLCIVKFALNLNKSLLLCLLTRFNMSFV